MRPSRHATTPHPRTLLGRADAAVTELQVRIAAVRRARDQAVKLRAHCEDSAASTASVAQKRAAADVRDDD